MPSSPNAAKLDPRYHSGLLTEVAVARQQLDDARSIVDRRSAKLDEAVARALHQKVPPTYIAKAARWSRTQVYRVKDREAAR